MRRELVTCSVAVLLATLIGRAAPPEPTEKLNDELRAVLREGISQATDRRERLRSLRKTSSRAARWASGYVEQQGEWIPFEELRQPQSGSAVRAEYLSRRATQDGSADGHLALAKWCRAHDLRVQEYAHVLAGVTLSPQRDHREALVRCGYREIEGQWVSPEQLSDWNAQAALATESVRLWGERLIKMPDQLAAGGRRERAALATIDQLRDVKAVPAITSLLCSQNERCALLGIERLKHIRAHESTLALSGQAVFNRWTPARVAASEALKERKFEDFVPELLSLMRVYGDGDVLKGVDLIGARLHYQYVVASETSDAVFVDATGTAVQLLNTRFAVGLYDLLDTRTLRDFVNNHQGFRTLTDIDRAAADEKFRRDKLLEQVRKTAASLNERVSAVLAAVTNETGRETPRDWWDWWDGYNQYEKKPKPTRTRSTQNVVGITLADYPKPSCLAAGTVVHTDNGPTSVEHLEIGDLVLSQNVETAELTYLPVLHTTARERTTVFRISTEAGAVVATGGHRFWVSGEGWRRVNDLKPGSLLHTATGSIAVTSIEPVPDEAVYNVVIAPTHNYFVGTQGLLTHDVTLPKPTNRLVPGLVEP